ncbi:MAG: HAD family hydrolase [Oligoflexia bacterium]|nr:HAD family hydrolase [Oligoflexia bacterium]
MLSKKYEKYKKCNNTYKNYIFDCDGVILDSNHIKTTAMKELVSPYGDEVLNEFICFHKLNAGLPRHKKFIHLFENILQIKISSAYEQKLKQILEDFKKITIKQLKITNEIVGFRDYISQLSLESKELKKSKKFVVSGAPQSDLDFVLKYKNLDIFFDEIYGSPNTKLENLNILNSKYDLSNSIYFGDSMIDYNMAMEFKMDFVFVYGKSEFEDWREFFQDNNHKDHHRNHNHTNVETIKDFNFL